MKFGDTLYQRSVPEWSINNVDYNDLKHLIKVYTSNDPCRAQAIPTAVNQAKAGQEFEQELYNELEKQHQRVTEFAHVKAGELSRRLVALDKHVTRLAGESAFHNGAGLSGRKAEKFSRLDSNILRVGEDIQSLSRFIRANALAFYKLLKKYRKWTGSRALEERFRSDILDHNSSFTKQSLESLLTHYTNSLESLRALYTLASGRHPTANTKTRLPSNSLIGSAQIQNPSARRLYNAGKTGSLIDFDISFVMTPLGNGAGRAVYWVHPDDIVNVKILLTRYTSLLKDHDLASPTDYPISLESALRSPTADSASLSQKDSLIGMIICDDINESAKRRSSETIEDNGNGSNSASRKSIARIRISRTMNPTIAFATAVESKSEGRDQGHKFVSAKLSRKDIRKLFDASNVNRLSNTEHTGNAEPIVQWFAEHPETRPLVKLQCRRSRFLGLRNSVEGGIWATLDTDIHLRQCCPEQVAGEKALLEIEEDPQQGFNSFPYAVLEVRMEGNGSAALIKALDDSHLVEKVRGFSLETHAVAALYEPHGTSRPFWMPALYQDLRKVPPTEGSPNGRLPKKKSIPEQGSTRNTSLSAESIRNGLSSSGFSGSRGESSATTAPDTCHTSYSKASKKKRRRLKRLNTSRSHSTLGAQSRQQRYWNEFDDASEVEQDLIHTIYIDPNAPNGFPGAARMSNFANYIIGKVVIPTEKLASWFQSSKSTDLERGPLMNGILSSPDDSDLSEDGAQSEARSARRYSTFSKELRRPKDGSRESLFLLGSSLSCFAASFASLIITTILLLTAGRKKSATEVDVSVVIGVTASLIFGIVGVSSMMARQASFGWPYRTVVLMIFLCILLLSFALLFTIDQAPR
ncbi:MAG: hypothetical protein Q9163_002503 [Psora crenata]